MMVVFDGTVFEIKKNLLKYGKDKKSFYYLGIYFSPDEESFYGGLIGENGKWERMGGSNCWRRGPL